MNLILEEVLYEFDIIGHVVEVTVGLEITQYQLILKPRTKIYKLAGINKEINLTLAKKHVRIQETIPGKSTTEIELSNETSKEIMEN